MGQKTKGKKKKKSESSDVFARVMRAIFTILFLVVVLVIMLLMTRQLYQFGYDIFGEKPGTGVEIEVEFEVMEGEPVMTIAGRLKDKNLISNEVIFILQKVLYEKEILAGVHVLDSNMTTLEILDELSMPPGRTDDN